MSQLNNRKPVSFYGPRTCPFCDSSVLEFGYSFYPDADRRWKNGTRVKCLGCRASGPEFLFYESPNEGEEKAVELWNDRISDQPKLF